MTKKIDLKGIKFGRLSVLKDSGQRSKYKQVIWMCICICGKIIQVRTDALRSGATKSCGCLHKDLITKHGDYSTKLYRIWTNMVARCYSPKNPSYKYYTKKDIKVCNEWKDNYLAFKFWAILNGYQEGLSIDRINSYGNYEPHNCQWLTWPDNVRKEWIDRR